MKIRTGHVSNSSSSSFIVGGVNLGPNADEGVEFVYPAQDLIDQYIVDDIDINDDGTYTIFMDQNIEITAKDGDKLKLVNESFYDVSALLLEDRVLNAIVTARDIESKGGKVITGEDSE